VFDTVYSALVIELSGPETGKACFAMKTFFASSVQAESLAKFPLII
jgi:hypothetical protein